MENSNTDPRLLALDSNDNVLILRGTITAGETIVMENHNIKIPHTLGLGHKLARRNISQGEKILKYGVSIGSATQDIPMGTHVHLHNLASDYTPTHSLAEEQEKRNEKTGHRL